jgi:hypothetical protein
MKNFILDLELQINPNPTGPGSWSDTLTCPGIIFETWIIKPNNTKDRPFWSKGKNVFSLLSKNKQLFAEMCYCLQFVSNFWKSQMNRPKSTFVLTQACLSCYANFHSLRVLLLVNFSHRLRSASFGLGINFFTLDLKVFDVGCEIFHIWRYGVPYTSTEFSSIILDAPFWLSHSAYKVCPSAL